MATENPNHNDTPNMDEQPNPKGVVYKIASILDSVLYDEIAYNEAIIQISACFAERVRETLDTRNILGLILVAVLILSDKKPFNETFTLENLICFLIISSAFNLITGELAKVEESIKKSLERRAQLRALDKRFADHSVPLSQDT